MAKLKGRLVPRFLVLAKHFFVSDKKWVGRGLLALLIVLMLLNTATSVLLNQQTGEFSSALAARDSARYWRSIWYSVGLVAFGIPVYGFYYFTRDKLTIHWRRWMTRYFLQKYFKNAAYYKLTFMSDLDNPDQRISEDINSYTTRSIYFLVLSIETLLQLIGFSGVLWAISHKLVYVILTYTFVGTFLTAVVFGRPLVRINFFQLRREADFRFGLVRIRENAEAIAFYRGEEEESRGLAHRFHEVFANFNRLINRQFFLNLFQFAFKNATLIIPGVILAPRVMSGDLEIGIVVQATGAFTAIFNALNIVVEKFDTVSLFAAGVGRLDRFADTLDEASAAPRGSKDRIQTQEDEQISMNQLTVQTPEGGRVLVRDISMQLAEGDSLLIVGTSGGGKSSLLRVLAGLWDSGDGTLSRPPLEQMLFLPQRPYLIIGSLRDQLIYPGRREDIPDDELREVLNKVNLPDIIERCGGLDEDADWGKILSLGEQQRIAFARALLSDRKYIILDEATSALDEKNEAELYEILVENSPTLISVSHRPQVARYHTHVLELVGDESWVLRTSEEYLGDLKKNGACR